MADHDHGGRSHLARVVVLWSVRADLSGYQQPPLAMGWERKFIFLVLCAVTAIYIASAKPPQKKHYHYQKSYHSYHPKGHPTKSSVPPKEPSHPTKAVHPKPAKVMTYTKKGYMPVHVPVHVPTYEFGYKIHDPQHRNFQEKTETKIGDAVQGYYSLLQPNGEVRVVRYQSDDSGFHSKVTLHKHQDGRGSKYVRS